MLLHHESQHAKLQVRSLYTSPPPARSSHSNNPTLLVSWWCTGFALAIIIVRISGRYIRTERLFREDKIMALSIIPLCIRMAFVHVILLYGTNNAIITDDFSPEDLRRRAIGSRLVLPSRIMYAAFLWIAKFTISEFLKRLTTQFWRRSYQVGLQIIRYFLLVTFVAVFIATLSECQPFRHYWQVRPDPGAKCRQGVTQLMTMGISDIITDLMLVCFPIPIVLKSTMAVKRIIGVMDHKYEQQFRSLLASLEILAAAAVSNALVLGSFVRDRGTKKQRYRRHTAASMSGHSSQDTRPTYRRNITQQNWGSDADLAGDLGICVANDLKEKDLNPRPAPLALPEEKDAKNLTPMPRRRSSRPPNIEIDEANRTLNLQQDQTDLPSPARTPSFFDVGGLLEGNEALPRSRQQSVVAHHFPDGLWPGSIQHAGPSSASRPTFSRKGSDAFLEDVGGISSKWSTSLEQRPGTHERGISLADILREENTDLVGTESKIDARHEAPTPEIQDAGGLLPSSSMPSTSEQRSLSLKSVLRDTGPETPQRRPRAPLDRALASSPPEIQDTGGLLSSTSG
ncbi:uncharacterized protein KY384_007044 [Bacidia gigantensis]|uniref:uncharacterized protein n=1 Tax=Bacidia gigantensis TaxID=2732470 RepID=UPI001D036DC2|nr:uncharacterized protein KY384_007044 [Bacidia gigantensis]KAG8528128.1 hypothetical protein KY384_007044 [Bacidia gigantensis]